MKVDVVVADYRNERHAGDLVVLLNAYAMDPMGGGVALSDEAQAGLAPALANIPHAFSLLAYVEDQAVGLVNCFEGFSTFACKPLINIHDVVVVSGHRGLGICGRMLEKVEAMGRERGCCKLTLEVVERNDVARHVYTNFGFSPYELDPTSGKALFWHKSL